MRKIALQEVILMSLRNDSNKIIESAINAALPNTAVKKALQNEDFSGGKLILVSIGKQPGLWLMRHANYWIIG